MTNDERSHKYRQDARTYHKTLTRLLNINLILFLSRPYILYDLGRS